MGANLFKWGQIYLFGSKYTYFLANEKIKILKHQVAQHCHQDADTGIRQLSIGIRLIYTSISLPDTGIRPPDPSIRQPDTGIRLPDTAMSYCLVQFCVRLSLV